MTFKMKEDESIGGGFMVRKLSNELVEELTFKECESLSVDYSLDLLSAPLG